MPILQMWALSGSRSFGAPLCPLGMHSSLLCQRLTQPRDSPPRGLLWSRQQPETEAELRISAPGSSPPPLTGDPSPSFCQVGQYWAGPALPVLRNPAGPCSRCSILTSLPSLSLSTSPPVLPGVTSQIHYLPSEPISGPVFGEPNPRH